MQNSSSSLHNAYSTSQDNPRLLENIKGDDL
jgi:hypothetical protein